MQKIKQRSYVILLLFLFLFSAWGNLVSKGFSFNNLSPLSHLYPIDNHPPLQPNKPQGLGEGYVGQSYFYQSSTIDPDGDQVYYLFDWGNGTNSSWLGPYDSGVIVQASQCWHKRGFYIIIVKAKDQFGIESPWSDPMIVEMFGSYLTFETITTGFGLTIEIKNLGELEARAVNVTISITPGSLVKAFPKNFEIPVIPVGNSTLLQVHIWGVALGIFADLPTLKLIAEAPDTKTRGKQIIVRVFGPLVKKVGESWVTDESYPGYTLYSPMVSLQALLIDNNGTVKHQWNSKYKPALSVYLLENGKILRTAFPRFNPRFFGGGLGGRVEIIDWNGSLVWWFEYTTDQYCLHHDVKILPNGNILMIAWEYKSAAEAITNGRNPNTIPIGQMWPDHLIEVQPTGDSGGTIVWEWHLWDHLIQDFDPTKENYGVVQNHPELVDINYGGLALSDWTHTNAVDYNEQLDQIMISICYFNEIWIIDHSTTTQEAADHSGGRYGHGGDLLYRWGNPRTYRMGTVNDQQFFAQHDAQWIEPGLPGAGDILVFNNGHGRPGGDASSADEIVPPLNSNGTYDRTPGTAYGPVTARWSYMPDTPNKFYALNLGGVQRLPNGNTLICDGPHGRFFEVTSNKEVVWEYKNQVPNPIDSHVYKIRRYEEDYPGLKFY